MIDFATGTDCASQDEDIARDLSGGTVGATANVLPIETADDFPPVGFTRGIPPYDDRGTPL